MILDKIVQHKRQEVKARKQKVPLAELVQRAAGCDPPLDLAAALQSEGVSLIAEVKRASPSKGLLCADWDPVRLATTYATNGAAAISVLTDRRFFQGELEYLALVRQAVGPTIPLLRKDFLLDSYQVYEARSCGADAVLLIAAILSDAELAELLDLVQRLGMTALVEVHDEDEVAQVLPLAPRVVGINNRNLHDFSVDLGTFGRLRALLPDHVVTVAESGVRDAHDVGRLAAMGADAVLVGEALVRAVDTAAKVRELIDPKDFPGRVREYCGARGQWGRGRFPGWS